MLDYQVIESISFDLTHGQLLPLGDFEYRNRRTARDATKHHKNQQTERQDWWDRQLPSRTNASVINGFLPEQLQILDR